MLFTFFLLSQTFLATSYGTHPQPACRAGTRASYIAIGAYALLKGYLPHSVFYLHSLNIMFATEMYVSFIQLYDECL